MNNASISKKRIKIPKINLLINSSVMIKKRFKKILYITDKKKIDENSLKTKTLEQLIKEKNEQHDTISIKFPTIISFAWIIITIILSFKSGIWWQFWYILNFVYSVLIIIYWLIFLRLIIVISNVMNEHEIISKNIKLYDKEIFERFKSENDRITNLLVEIRDNTKQK